MSKAAACIGFKSKAKEIVVNKNSKELSISSKLRPISISVISTCYFTDFFYLFKICLDSYLVALLGEENKLAYSSPAVSGEGWLTASETIGREISIFFDTFGTGVSNFFY